MQHVDITTADTRIIAHCWSALDSDKTDWDALIVDTLKGTRHVVTFTKDEFATVLLLMVAGEDYPINSRLLYAIVEDKLDKIPPEFRPVP